MSVFILGLYVLHIPFLIRTAERVCVQGITLLQKYISVSLWLSLSFPFLPYLLLWTKVFLVAHVSDTPPQTKTKRLKGKFSPKWKFCDPMLTLVSFQTCLICFCRIQKNIFWRMLIKKLKPNTHLPLPLTSSMDKKLWDIYQNIVLCVLQY